MSRTEEWYYSCHDLMGNYIPQRDALGPRDVMGERILPKPKRPTNPPVPDTSSSTPVVVVVVQPGRNTGR